MQRTPRDIIISWIEKAGFNGYIEHKIAFWMVWDLVDGYKHAERYRQQSIEFLRTRCKESPDREILIKTLVDKID